MGKVKKAAGDTNVKPKKPSYNGRILEEAVKKVLQDDWSIYKAAKFYAIPWTTLKENVVKSTEHFDCNTNVLNKFVLGKVGRPFALPSALEVKLASYIIKMQEYGFGLTVKQIRKLAYTIAVKGAAKRFSSANKTAGKKWFCGFKKRFNLTLRKPENLSRYRASCTNPTLLQQFYDCLEKLLDEHNLRNCPSQIWNCDETGLMFVTTTGSKIVTSVGKKFVYRRVYAERGTTTTVLACANAAGKSGPLLIIFKGVQNIPALKTGAHCDAMVEVTPKGWINSELFLRWMQKFIESLPPARPVLLVMDSHASHLSPEALQMAEDNRIILLTFPSHTTHVLQPLDVSVYRSLKVAWSSELDMQMRKNPGKIPSRYEFHGLFNPCYEKSFSPQIIRAGFQKTGIFPFNRNAISPEAMAPSAVSEKPVPENTPNLNNEREPLAPLVIPMCEPNTPGNSRRKSQSAKVHTVSPTSSTDPGSDQSGMSSRPRVRCSRNTRTSDEENSLCSGCDLDYKHDMRKKTGAQWIQCCFCLQWYHNKCEGLADDFEEDVYMCSQCAD